MKVMYFGFEGFDNDNGNNHLIIKMIDSFLSEGIEVYYLSSHTVGKNPDIPEILKNRSLLQYDIIERQVVNKKNFVIRYLNGIHYAFKSIKFWKKHRKSIDVIILQSRPTAVLSAILLKLIMKKPIIFNYYDIFPNGPYLYGAITNKYLFYILKFLQHVLYRCCDKILTISEDTRQTLLNEGVPDNKIEIIRNWYNEDQIQVVNLSNNKFVKKYNIDTSKFILQYAGNFGFTFNYLKILEIAENLLSFSNIEFHMIGTGTFENDFKNEAMKRNLTNIKFFPWQSLDIISDVYSYCDIEIIPLSKGVIWTSYPSKCSLLMACKKPFICITETESNFFKTVNENEIGICVPIDDLNYCIQTIKKISTNSEQLKKIANNAYVYGSIEYSSNKNIKKLINIIEELGE